MEQMRIMKMRIMKKVQVCTTRQKSCTSACANDAHHWRTPMMDQVAMMDHRGPLDQGGDEEERKEKKKEIVDELSSS
jgi:hypothetical protein